MGRGEAELKREKVRSRAERGRTENRQNGKKGTSIVFIG